jgi:broad specificity phosphatase PhoE
MAKNIFWVRHAESCSNLVKEDMIDNIYTAANKHNHPVLTIVGVQQAILLGSNYINTSDIKYDKGYVSPLARTIMTALLSMRTYSYQVNPDFLIEVVPYISEKVHELGLLDYSNKIMSPRKIKLMIKLIKDWLEKFWLVDYIDTEFHDELNKIDNIQIKRDNIDAFNTNYKNHITRKILSPSTLQILLNTHIRPILVMYPALQKFFDRNFLRGPKISLLSYNNKIYEEVLKPEFYKVEKMKEKKIFIPSYAGFKAYLQENEYKNIICFSHGTILRTMFEKEQFSALSSITEEPSDVQKLLLLNTGLFKESSQILSPLYPLGDNRNVYDNLKSAHNKERKVEECFTKNKFNEIINKIAYFPDQIVTNPYNIVDSTSPFYSLTTSYNNLYNMIDTVNVLDSNDIMKKKYLKYKLKYLKLKKI